MQNVQCGVRRMIMIMIINENQKIIEGSLEAKLPTIRVWTVEKAEVRRVRREKNQKKEDVDARKDRKVAIHWVFPMICGSGGSKKVGSLKRRVRSQLAR